MKYFKGMVTADYHVRILGMILGVAWKLWLGLSLGLIAISWAKRRWERAGNQGERAGASIALLLGTSLAFSAVFSLSPTETRAASVQEHGINALGTLPGGPNEGSEANVGNFRFDVLLPSNHSAVPWINQENVPLGNEYRWYFFFETSPYIVQVAASDTINLTDDHTWSHTNKAGAWIAREGNSQTGSYDTWARFGVGTFLNNERIGHNPGYWVAGGESELRSTKAVCQ